MWSLYGLPLVTVVMMVDCLLTCPLLVELPARAEGLILQHSWPEGHPGKSGESPFRFPSLPRFLAVSHLLGCTFILLFPFEGSQRPSSPRCL